MNMAGQVVMQRQCLIPAITCKSPLSECQVPPSLRVRNLNHLRALLQEAVKLEHTTIPPYLCGLYSIKDGTNREAAEVILSVVMEEMLHMALAANVLRAIGGHAVVNQREFVPNYPVQKKDLPGFNFDIGLERFSKHALDVFVEIEAPADPTNSVDPNLTRPSRLTDFKSIARFYQAIQWGIIELSKTGNIFSGASAKQIEPQHYYGGGGKVIRVTDCESALQALNEIIGQGEGIPGSIWESKPLEPGRAEFLEVAHFYRFVEIREGKRYRPGDENGPHPAGKTFPLPTGDAIDVCWDPENVYPMRTNPKLKDLPPGSSLLHKATAFNQTYMGLLNRLQDAFNGEPELMMQSVGIMYDLKYQAIELMKIPVPGTNDTAGPSFEYLPPA